jgi:hypothetical protein
VVISTDRSRVPRASMIAVSLSRPRSGRSLANSTIRMLFFDASPTSVIGPILMR